MPRPKVHDDALRVRLLENAVRTLSQHGVDALSLRKLAAQVDTSTTAVYSLFGGKPGLLNAVFDEAFRRFGERMDDAELTGDPRSDLYALAMAYRASALAEPHFYQIMFGPIGGAVEPDEETLTRARGTFQPLVTAVRKAIDAGQLRADNATAVATTMWAAVHGMVSLELRSLLPPGSGDPAELYRQSVLAIGAGWLGRDAATEASTASGTPATVQPSATVQAGQTTDARR
jgi:AcrR family transcriptional regulator